MNSIVRRSANTPLINDGGQTFPERFHRSGPIVVRSQLIVGIEPRFRFSWNIFPERRSQGHTLFVFRSYSGFAANKETEDLSDHGQLIIETTEDGMHEEVPLEGPHYITCLLHRKIFFGCFEQSCMVRFSETVPSARVAIGRMKDQLELRELMVRIETARLEHEARINEAEARRRLSYQQLEQSGQSKRKPRRNRDPFVESELSDIDAMIEAAIAKEGKIAELRKSRRFRQLSRQQQREILDRVAERLDPAEVNARRDLRGK